MTPAPGRSTVLLLLLIIARTQLPLRISPLRASRLAPIFQEFPDQSLTASRITSVKARKPFCVAQAVGQGFHLLRMGCSPKTALSACSTEKVEWSRCLPSCRLSFDLLQSVRQPLFVITPGQVFAFGY